MNKQRMAVIAGAAWAAVGMPQTYIIAALLFVVANIISYSHGLTASTLVMVLFSLLAQIVQHLEKIAKALTVISNRRH